MLSEEEKADEKDAKDGMGSFRDRSSFVCHILSSADELTTTQKKAFNAKDDFQKMREKNVSSARFEKARKKNF